MLPPVQLAEKARPSPVTLQSEPSSEKVSEAAMAGSIQEALVTGTSSAAPSSRYMLMSKTVPVAAGDHRPRAEGWLWAEGFSKMIRMDQLI